MHFFNSRLVPQGLKLIDFKFRSINLTFVYIVFVIGKEWDKVTQHKYGVVNDNLTYHVY
jgi:hypothetical protein